MAPNMNALYRLLVEHNDFLLFESEASEQAKVLNLSYAGFGYWKDADNHVVARTVNGKLVKLGPGEVPKHHDLEPDKIYEPDGSMGEDDPEAVVASNVTPEKALTDLAYTAVQFAGLNAKNKKVVNDIAKMILLLAATGKVPEGHMFIQMLPPANQQALLQYLDVLAKNKNTQAMQALGAFLQDLKPAKDDGATAAAKEKELAFMKQKKDAEPPKQTIPFDHNKFNQAVANKIAQQVAAQPPAASEPTEPAEVFDLKKAAKIIGLDPDTTDPETWQKFVDIMKKAEDAETSVQINYVRALLKKSGLLGATKQAQWAKWKDLLRFIKSSKKNLIKGPKEKGKIKNKFIDQDGNEVEVDGEEEPDDTQILTPVQSAPAAQPFDMQEYVKWWQNLPDDDKTFVKKVFSDFFKQAGVEAIDFSTEDQGKIAMAIGNSLNKGDGDTYFSQLAKDGTLLSYQADALVSAFDAAWTEKNPPKIEPKKDLPVAQAIQQWPNLKKISLDWDTIKALQEKTPADRNEIMSVLNEAINADHPNDLFKLLSHLESYGVSPSTFDKLTKAALVLWTEKNSDLGGLENIPLFQGVSLSYFQSYLTKDFPAIAKTGLLEQLPNAVIKELYLMPLADEELPWAIANAALHSSNGSDLADNLSDLKDVKMSSENKIKFGVAIGKAWKGGAEQQELDNMKTLVDPNAEAPSTPDTSVEFGKEADTFNNFFNAYQNGQIYVPDDQAATSTDAQNYNDAEPDTADDLANQKMVGVLDKFFQKTGLDAGDFTPSEYDQLEDNLKKVLMGQLPLKGSFNFMDPETFGMFSKIVEPLIEKPKEVANETPLDGWFKTISLSKVGFAPAALDMLNADANEYLAGKMSAEQFKQTYQDVILSANEVNSLLIYLNKKKAEAGSSMGAVPASTPAVAGDLKSAVEKYEIKNPKAAKSAATSMAADWSKGNPETVMKWYLGKYQGKGNATPSPKTFWQDAAMALVKNFDYPIDKVPQELLPDEIKTAMSSSPTQVEPEESAVEKVLGKFLSVLPDEVIITPADQAKVISALNIAINTGDSGKLQDLTNTTDLDAIQVHALKQILNGEEPTKLIKPTHEPETQAEKNKGKQQTSADAASYLENFLAGAGIPFNSLGGENKVKLIDATKEALNATSEFGVIYAFHDIDGKNIITQDALDAFKYNILEKVGKDTKLDTSEEAFKKYLNPKSFVEEFLTGNPTFATTLSPQDKQKLIDTATIGLAFTGPKGYAEAKALYQKELVGKVPGFNDSVFTEWRHGLMKYHDKLKNMGLYLQQKKTELMQKIKEAEETKKALEAISTGDTATKINAIASSVGVSDAKVKLAIAKAMAAPTSQQALDHIFDLTSSYTAYAGDPTYAYHTKTSTIPADKQKMLRNLVSAAWFDQHHKVEIDGPEPKVNEPVTQRLKHVLDNWVAKFGMTPGHVPSGNGEKKNLIDTLTQALTEPDPKKVNSIVSGLLATATSLGDKHVNQLRQLVMQERKKPASLNGKAGVFEPKPYTATASATPTGNKTIHGDVSNDKEFTDKFKYYKLPDHKKKEIHDAVFSTLTKNITPFNRASEVNKLENQLKHIGLSEDTAHKVALWATREAKDNTALAQKAKKIIQATAAPNVTMASGGSVEAKKKLADIPSHSCANSHVKMEYVQGEEIKFATGTQATPLDLKHDTLGQADSIEQNKWRNANLPATVVKAFNEAANSWQGSSQWLKNHAHRKAMNEIMTRIVEGPPPMYAKASGCLSRGINMNANDFADFIKAFEIGKPVYVGPSGFSANLGTAKSFGGWDSGQHPDYTKVMLRVLPNSAGQVKGARLANRTGPAGQMMHGGEAEIVIGTGKHLVCTNVIKHVVKDYNGTYHASYEIVMQYNENLNESVQQSGGFRADLWKGMDRNTVKALIKYMNTSVRFTSNDGDK